MCSAKFRDCAHMYTEYDFISAYIDFGRRFPKAADYLDGSVPVEKWARCYFKGGKYNLDTSNACESMNSVFKRARKYSLLPLIDAYVKKLSEWFNKHIATHLLVTELNGTELEYNITGVDGKRYQVDLLRKSCSCRCFDIDKIPCVHAIAASMALMHQEGRIVDIQIYDLCSKYYLIQTWSLAYCRTIYLVPHESTWNVPKDIRQSVVHPLDYTKNVEENKTSDIPPPENLA
ncbi:uncharacterized protein LOC112086112 [Eutrema salsugineum]|uniref:uncharacterized protein LOC112086112 n=1 Tax=Eutrema salsugineum TaxID=72664 RepID=UPI000CED3C4C|nr:uncharacterized protein LOC112086112 [Eutrema salsugineum]